MMLTAQSTLRNTRHDPLVLSVVLQCTLRLLITMKDMTNIGVVLNVVAFFQTTKISLKKKERKPELA